MNIEHLCVVENPLEPSFTTIWHQPLDHIAGISSSNAYGQYCSKANPLGILGVGISRIRWVGLTEYLQPNDIPRNGLITMRQLRERPDGKVFRFETRLHRRIAVYVGLVYVNSDIEGQTSSFWYGAKGWRACNRLRYRLRHLTTGKNCELHPEIGFALLKQT
ncbi:hypothetical protein AVEN_7372-1 [Araneus ventricosus]|uniref:Uncharacterized protein n=1 Tax=Araneus ventricosus TaxID=182803 RepID=A0A4Y2BQB3_ARAVE|nr:hypothetical protein AVEN_7372-1 [Araneus ventricosus]